MMAKRKDPPPQRERSADLAAAELLTRQHADEQQARQRSAALQALLDEAEAELSRRPVVPEPRRRRPAPARQIPVQPDGSELEVPSPDLADVPSPAPVLAPRVNPVVTQRPSREDFPAGTAPAVAATVRTIWHADGARRSPVIRATGPRRSRRPGATRGRNRRIDRSRRAQLRRNRMSGVARAVAGYGLCSLSPAGRKSAKATARGSRRVRTSVPARTTSSAAARTVPTAQRPPLTLPAPPLPVPSRPPTAQTRPTGPAHPLPPGSYFRVSPPARPGRAPWRHRALLLSTLAVVGVIAVVVFLAWQLNVDRSPLPPASPGPVATAAATTSSPPPATSSAVSPPVTASISAPTASPAAGATATRVSSPAPTTPPPVLRVPTGPTSVRPGDRQAATVIPGSTRLTGWIPLMVSPDAAGSTR